MGEESQQLPSAAFWLILSYTRSHNHVTIYTCALMCTDTHTHPCTHICMLAQVCAYNVKHTLMNLHRHRSTYSPIQKCFYMLAPNTRAGMPELQVQVHRSLEFHRSSLPMESPTPSRVTGTWIPQGAQHSAQTLEVLLPRSCKAKESLPLTPLTTWPPLLCSSDFFTCVRVSGPQGLCSCNIGHFSI